MRSAPGDPMASVRPSFGCHARVGAMFEINRSPEVMAKKPRGFNSGSPRLLLQAMPVPGMVTPEPYPMLMVKETEPPSAVVTEMCVVLGDFSEVWTSARSFLCNSSAANDGSNPENVFFPRLNSTNPCWQRARSEICSEVVSLGHGAFSAARTSVASAEPPTEGGGFKAIENPPDFKLKGDRNTGSYPRRSSRVTNPPFESISFENATAKSPW